MFPYRRDGPAELPLEASGEREIPLAIRRARPVMNAPRSESDLIAAAQDGDRRAFAELVALHGGAGEGRARSR